MRGRPFSAPVAAPPAPAIPGRGGIASFLKGKKKKKGVFCLSQEEGLDSGGEGDAHVRSDHISGGFRAGGGAHRRRPAGGTGTGAGRGLLGGPAAKHRPGGAAEIPRRPGKRPPRTCSGGPRRADSGLTAKTGRYAEIRHTARFQFADGLGPMAMTYTWQGLRSSHRVGNTSNS